MPRWVTASWAVVALSIAAVGLGDEPRIVIDGAFEDWVGSIPTAEDPFDAPEGELDLGLIAITHDRDAIYVQLEFAEIVLLQGLEGTATLLFDADGDQATGATQLGVPGVDVAVVFSPPEPDWTAGARGTTVRSVGSIGSLPGETLSSYELGLITAPTHAGNRFEIRIERGIVLPGTPQLFRGSGFSVAFAYLGLDGEVGERSDVLTYTFGPTTTHQQQEVVVRDPLARAAATELRVLSWNISAGAIFEQTEAFRRILAALQPDILLFDEAPLELDAATVLGLLGDLPKSSSQTWSAAVGPGGGRQHAVAMSHYPVALAPALARIPYPDDFPAYLSTIDREWIQEDLQDAATDGVSSAGFVIDLGERRLLVVPLDLQCCGRLDEPEDRIRQIQATAIHGAVSAALPELDVDGVILSGDLNLVASRKPLDLLRSGLDVDGSDLEVLDAIQLDGRSAATWGFSGSFSTSRLDYLLYSDSELMPLNAFVFDARDLAPEWLDAHGLTPQDARVSGHLPIVVDLKWAYPAE